VALKPLRVPPWWQPPHPAEAALSWPSCVPSLVFWRVICLSLCVSVCLCVCVSVCLCVCAAAAAKSLQSCPILCDPIDGSPPGSPVPGILQARTLEWVAISFSNTGHKNDFLRFCFCSLKRKQKWTQLNALVLRINMDWYFLLYIMEKVGWVASNAPFREPGSLNHSEWVSQQLSCRRLHRRRVAFQQGPWPSSRAIRTRAAAGPHLRRWTCTDTTSKAFPRQILEAVLQIAPKDPQSFSMDCLWTAKNCKQPNFHPVTLREYTEQEEQKNPNQPNKSEKQCWAKETRVPQTGQADLSPIRVLFTHTHKAMAPHSSTLAWKIPWTEEPGRLQSMGSLRVRHDWVTSFSLFLSCIGEGNGNPLQCSCLENPRDRGSLVGCRLWGRTESDTTEVT